MSLRLAFFFVFFLALMVYLAGCSTSPPATPASAAGTELPAEVILDFGEPASAGTGASLEQVLRVVSEAAAWNFTFNESTGKGLAAAHAALEGRRKVRRGALEVFVAEVLDAHGFALSRVGPAELRTWLVEPAAGGPREAAFRAIPLAHAEAAAAAAACRGLATDAPLTIVPDPRTNSLFVYARAADLERVQARVAEIEAAAAHRP